MVILKSVTMKYKETIKENFYFDHLSEHTACSCFIMTVHVSASGNS